MGIEENKAVVRQYLTGMRAAPPDLTVFDELLAANYEGDRIGQKALGFVHCRFADGKIVAQDVMTNPDMTPVLAPLLAPPTGR
jgi:hypothetical protein